MSVYKCTINNGLDEIVLNISTEKPKDTDKITSLSWVPLENGKPVHQLYKHVITKEVLEYLKNPTQGIWCYSYE